MSVRIPYRLARPLALRTQQARTTPQWVRSYTDQGRMSKETGGEGESMVNIPHVSEEDAAIKSSMGEQPPELDQGTKVSEAVKGDKEAQENLPKVMQDAMKKKEGMPNKSPQTRPYSTLSRAQLSNTGRRSYSTTISRQQAGRPTTRGAFRDNVTEEDLALEKEALLTSNQLAVEEAAFDDELSMVDEDQGVKFGLPTLPLPPGSNLKKRYEPIVDQVTKLLMRDGKLSAAQRNMNTILTHLRTSPAPRADAKHPLLPGSPPHSSLPLNPTLYLTLAIDSVAPIFRIRSQRGAAGGGVALQLPVPLRERQRRRTAVQWILDAADKRKGGTSSFAKRVAEEIVSVAEGRSSCWTRRDALHAMGIRARANLTVMAARQRR